MIRSLRARFIRMAMLSVALVIGVIIAITSILGYRNATMRADTILEIFEQQIRETGTVTVSSDKPPARDQLDAQNNMDSRPVRPDSPAFRRRLFQETLSRETMFESRFFYMTVNAAGEIQSSDTSHITLVGDDDLDEFQDAVSSKATPSTGYFDRFRFLKTDLDGDTLLLFLDCDRSIKGFHATLQYSILAATLVLAGVFLLVCLFSGKVIAPVKESYEKQKRFITDAGHELKTPLTIIDADISVAEMEMGENEWLSDVRVQTKRLADLTGDLIYLSRMDEGMSELTTIEFPLSDLVHDTVQSFRSRIQLAEKTLETDIQPDITYTGDEKALEKLLTILLDNAVKYSRDKGKIAIALKKKQKSVSLSVENETDQITTDMLHHAFDRFYRQDSSRNSSGGYGIGLSIAKAVASAHGGTIDASAPAPDRMRISVQLPLS